MLITNIFHVSEVQTIVTSLLLIIYLQFWPFIERSQNFFYQNKINYYVYLKSLSNIHSVIEYTLLVYFIREETDYLVSKKYIFHGSMNVQNCKYIFDKKNFIRCIQFFKRAESCPPWSKIFLQAQLQGVTMTTLINIFIKAAWWGL